MRRSRRRIVNEQRGQRDHGLAMVVKPAYQLEPDDGSVRQPGPAGIAIPAAVEQDASHFRIRLRIEVRKELGSHFQNIRDNVRLLVRDRPYLLMTAFFDIPPRT